MKENIILILVLIVGTYNIIEIALKIYHKIVSRRKKKCYNSYTLHTHLEKYKKLKRDIDELTQILKPYATWFDDGDNNEKAKAALTEFYIKLKNHKSDKQYISNGYHFSYILQLIKIKEAFEENKYMRVCNEIINILHFQSVYQPRIQYNLLHLINEYLCVDNAREHDSDVLEMQIIYTMAKIRHKL